MPNTDREWEKYGKFNPYFGVLSDEKYSKHNLTDQRLEEFFRSGEDHMREVLEKVKKHIDPVFVARKAMDFGCGVGRLVIPLSNIAEEVVGVDVSRSMLDEARRNCVSRSIRNVKLLIADDELSTVDEEFNFIHSFIVFQHIPVKRGGRLFSKLLARLEAGGVGVVHFTYAKKNAGFNIRKLIDMVKENVPLAKNLFNLIRGRGFFAPSMQMNLYNLNELFFIMQSHNIRQIFTEYTDHGGVLGVVFYMQKGE